MKTTSTNELREKKMLIFEGAGCVPRGEVENCRIRSAFHLDNGQPVYLEIIGFEVNKHNSAALGLYAPFAASVDSCFEIHSRNSCEDENGHTIKRQGKSIRGERFRYTKSDILSFINSLGASFDEIKILNDGYRVFAGNGKYNFGDEQE